MDGDETDSRTLGLSNVLPKKSGAFDPTFSGPRDVDRDFTDRGSFMVFCVFVGCVGAIAANAFLFGPGELEKLPRVFTTDGKACGTDDFAADTRVLVWWPEYEPSVQSEAGELTVCSAFCPMKTDRVCLNADHVVIRAQGGTGLSPDPNCFTDALVWTTDSVQRFGRCFEALEECSDQNDRERAELDKISSMDITIRALLDMWYSRWLILAVGCAIPIFFSIILVKWLTRRRASKESFRIALPHITLSLIFATLPTIALQVLNQQLGGFFECFYVDKFLMPVVTYVALAILAMAVIMTIASFLLRKKLAVCSKLAIETARCLKDINGAQNMIIFSCMASCCIAIGWFGMGSYVICWALDLEARDKINPNLRIIILISFSIGCLWLAGFVGAVSRLTMSGAVCDWFWQHRPKDTKNSLKLSLMRTLRRHPGTAAKGSMLITLLCLWRLLFSVFFGLFRTILRYLKTFREIAITIVYKKKVEKVTEIDVNGEDLNEAKKKRKGTSSIYTISRRAYNSVALHGRGLIDSGVTTKRILKKNYFRVGNCYDLMGEINVILTFLILVMCLCLSVIAGKVFQQPNGLGKGSESPIGMIFCVMLTSFTAIQGAFAPFHQASTTLIQCFCEDLERNDGSPVSPYRAYKGLREIIAQEHKDAFSMSNQKKTLGEMLHLEDGEHEAANETKVNKAKAYLLEKMSNLKASYQKAVGKKKEESSSSSSSAAV